MKILRKILEFLGGRNGIRFVSLVSAVAVWYAIRAATSNSLLVTDVVLSVQPPPDWTVVEQSAKTVDVAFLGTRDDLRFLNRELIKATVDARTRTNEESFVVSLGERNVNSLGNARVDFIRPAQVVVRLDREISKQVPVKVETQNLLPDGYEIEKITVVPATILLSGPARRLAGIESVSTMPVDLDGRIRSFSKRRIPLVSGDAMAGVVLDPPAVTLDMNVVERSVSVRFPDVPVLPMMPPGVSLRAEIEPEVASVVVKGRPDVAKNLAAEDVVLFVDATDVTGKRAVKLPVRAVLPPGVSLVGAEPAAVSVQLKE